MFTDKKDGLIFGLMLSQRKVVVKDENPQKRLANNNRMVYTVEEVKTYVR